MSLAPRVIACLDVRDGRVVKGVRFQGLRDMGDPGELARAYQDQGTDEIVLLDVSATNEARRARLDTIRRVRRRLSIPLTVGGGVRGDDDASALLDAGADKVSLNSAAVADPDLLGRLASRFGSQCVVLAIDAALAAEHPRSWMVRTHSGIRSTEIDAVAWAARGAALGAGEILLTSFDRDGTRSGYDLELLRGVAGAVNVPVIASGGADTPRHMLEALRAGADAVLAASIFHEGEWTVSRVKQELVQAGVEVRT